MSTPLVSMDSTESVAVIIVGDDGGGGWNGMLASSVGGTWGQAGNLRANSTSGQVHGTPFHQHCTT
jgi:hypothetical protein